MVEIFGHYWGGPPSPTLGGGAKAPMAPAVPTPMIAILYVLQQKPELTEAAVVCSHSIMPLHLFMHLMNFMKLVILLHFIS